MYVMADPIVYYIIYAVLFAIFLFVIYFAFILFKAMAGIRKDMSKNVWVLGPFILFSPRMFTDDGNTYRIKVLYMTAIAMIVGVFYFVFSMQ